MARKQQHQHCLINQHQKTALKMNGTRSNSLAKVNYSGVELTPLPNILLRTKIQILFFFSPRDPIQSLFVPGLQSFAAEDQCLLCQGHFRQTTLGPLFRLFCLSRMPLVSLLTTVTDPQFQIKALFLFSINCIPGSGFQLNEKKLLNSEMRRSLT